MKCSKCGNPTIGDNLICEDCRSWEDEMENYFDWDEDENDEINDPNDSINL